MTLLSDHERSHGGTVRLAEDQMQELRDLLRHGAEVAKLYLADYHKHNTPPDEPAPVPESPPSDDPPAA